MNVILNDLGKIYFCFHCPPTINIHKMSVGTKNYQKLTGCRINDVSPSPCCSKKVTINRTDHAVLIMIDKPACIIVMYVTENNNNITSFQAEGLTAIECWVIACIIFVFGALLEYTVILLKLKLKKVQSLTKKGED